MKSLTMREFFHSPLIVKSLHAEQSLVVTSRGKPDIVATQAGRRQKRTAEQLRQEAKTLLSRPGKKVNTVELIRRAEVMNIYPDKTLSHLCQLRKLDSDPSTPRDRMRLCVHYSNRSINLVKETFRSNTEIRQQ